MQRAIATWNAAEQIWETEATDLFSEKQVPYSAAWPTSGMTRNGQLTPLPTASHRAMDESGLLLLPTPVAQHSGNPPEVHLRKKPGRSRVTDLAIVVENGLLATGGLLPQKPTPTSNPAPGSTGATHQEKEQDNE